MADAVSWLSGLQRSRVNVDQVEVSPFPQFIMPASAGTKCATAAALSLAFTAANQESVACSGVQKDAVDTGAVAPAALAGAALAGPADDAGDAGDADPGPAAGPVEAGSWPAEVAEAAHEQTAQAARVAARAAIVLCTACAFTAQVKHGRRLAAPFTAIRGRLAAPATTMRVMARGSPAP